MTKDTANIEEIEDFEAGRIFEQVRSLSTPVVMRGLASNWPLVKKSLETDAAVGDYLKAFYDGKPVTAFASKGDMGGRIFYTEGLREHNFQVIKTDLGTVFEQLDAARQSGQTIYVGSSAIDFFLPGLSEENSLPQHGVRATVRIWIGNRTVVAAHYDVLDNIACVCAGRRRFTLFPPNQLPNLYVGPIDYTPAGQSVSLVDINEPDFERFPRFAEALRHAQTALLEPGDAIFIPSMWWHHVQGLDDLNILINHWWRDVPAHAGPPGDALLHAILNIRDLSPQQRQAWRDMFDYYVFDCTEERLSHIPPDKRGVIGELDEDTVRQVRARLRQNLNR